uniref:BTB domain-containing protein n=1 Tax=Arcella intermedia TaxID=1963864 RepID=A0A6B2LAE6_9EUKA
MVYLNIGGVKFVTTKTTLLSKGQNFFTPLIKGQIKSHKDKHGAFFIDRNGEYFKPLLDFLRHGELLVPPNIKLEHVLVEADFYSINLIPGLCGNIKEGLYTSSNWIIFLERDQKHPWIFGITGVEDDISRETRNVFLKQVCTVVDSKLQWHYNGNLYELYVRQDKLYIWEPNVYNSETQLFFRCPNSNKFPLEITEVLTSDKSFDGKSITLSFSTTPKGAIQAKTELPTNPPESHSYEIEVLCRRLLIMHTLRDAEEYKMIVSSSEKSTNQVTKKGDWLFYLHSDLAFFCFAHKYMDFGSAFYRTTPRNH